MHLNCYEGIIIPVSKIPKEFFNGFKNISLVEVDIDKRVFIHFLQFRSEECESVKPIVVANPCDIILSKTPSITYISSKEKLHLIGKSTSSLEPIFKSCPNGDQLDVLSVPLATGSLDRAKEQRVPKSTATTVCGSLDRAVASTQNKLVPTYVNVLIRNQVTYSKILANHESFQETKHPKKN